MNRLVILELEGDFDQTGFRAILDIRKELDSTSLKVRAFLPPAPEIAQALHKHWGEVYRSLGLTQRIKTHKIIHKGSLNQRIVTCRTSAKQLRDRFLAWLNSPSFQPIDRRLREELHRGDAIRFLIRTEDVNLQRLPWSEWDFFNRYPNAELALSPAEYEVPSDLRSAIMMQPTPKSAVRILAILGHRQGINLESDRQVLEQLPHAEVEFLVEPSRQQVSDRLWEHPWDILFFAGHSETEGETGRIYINPVDSFTLSELKYGLQKAIDHGLQLAIFNSCDGLGLARELRTLSIAQMILMREPVMDQVAETFLQYFLNAFSRGESLYLASRHARERLQGLEDRYPCASWLPVIYQHPLATPPDWDSLRGVSSTSPQADATTHRSTHRSSLPPSIAYRGSNHELVPSESPHAAAIRSLADQPASHQQSSTVTALDSSAARSGTEVLTPTPPEPNPQVTTSGDIAYGMALPHHPFRLTPWLVVGRIALAVTLVVMFLRLGGVFQGLELAAYDHLMQLRPAETVDSRILVVEVTQEDVNSQGGYPLTDQTLADAIDKLQGYQPKAIALDLHRYQPRGEGRQSFIQHFQPGSNVFLVCGFNDPNVESLGQDYGPPPEFSPTQRLEQMGFSNFPIDGATTVRRHLLSYQPTLATTPSTCTTPFSLSFQLAYYFLAQSGMAPLTITNQELWQLGDVVFHPLPQRFGGYQSLNGQSYQVMLNYRGSAPGQRVSFTDVLQGKIDKSLVSDRLVLIGYTAAVARDTVNTPYGPMAGVWVHAHMVSQILSAVLDNRPLIWSLPQWRSIPWGEALWVFSWSLLAGLIAYYWCSYPWRLGGAIALIIVAIHQISLLILTQGGWLTVLPTLLSVIGVAVVVVFYGSRPTRLKEST